MESKAIFAGVVSRTAAIETRIGAVAKRCGPLAQVPVRVTSDSHRNDREASIPAIAFCDRYVDRHHSSISE
ncbi:hypothetical protein [Natrinema ejinorense]|uniref:Uncharacterized protein n=1 Tax=Natrinema ejinorense TaxID=373386 RepID=A0A2A5QPF9_9EURY|nr:hypothetical protein [Natrinema ejinorense]PCR88728.1 hypothetical protein CP557_19690 [Natrinema ejinorense]